MCMCEVQNIILLALIKLDKWTKAFFGFVPLRGPLLLAALVMFSFKPKIENYFKVFWQTFPFDFMMNGSLGVLELKKKKCFWLD